MVTSKNNIYNFFIFDGVKALTLFILVCLIASALLGYQVPQFVAQLSRHYDNTQAYYESIRSLFLIFLAVYLNRVAYQLALNKYVKDLVQHTRTTIYQKWLLTYELYFGDNSHRDKYPQGEVMARIMNDTMAVRELMTSGTFGIIIDIFFVGSCLVGFITINTKAGAFLVSAEVFAALLLVWGGKYMRNVFHSVRKSKGLLSQSVANVVGGVREAYYTQHDGYASKRGLITFNDFLKKQLRANIWDASYYSLAESLYPLLLALLVFVFPYTHITEAAVIFAIVDLIQRSIDPIKSIAGKIANIQRAATGIQRIQEFTGDLDSGVISTGLLTQSSGELKSFVVNIPYFSYGKNTDLDQGQFFLDGINFEAHSGQLIGIAGPSGCGKSTLLNILSGNIIPKEGDVSVFLGESCYSIPGRGHADIIHYREKVGIVSQDSHIFSESLRFNLTLENNEGSDTHFVKFWSWIKEQIPYLDTWGLSPDNKITPQELSLGQSQLLSAIRSLYLKKPIVLFDEVSSGLDSELEYALRKVVLLIQEKSLTFLVAHRIETIIEADQILVMNEGKIVDRGKHKELLNDSAIYKEFIAKLSQ